MKTIVIFDSLYGNTKAIAEAVGKGFGSDTKVVNVKEATAATLRGLDLLVVGSPTHAGRPSKATKDFLKNIPAESLSGIRVAAFDTRNSIEDQGTFVKMIVNFFGYAAGRILETLEQKGETAAAEPEGFIVNDKEGPLQEGEPERATEWAKTISNNMSV